MSANQRPPRRLEGQVVLVTGAARGVGRRAVELFLAEGAKVVATDRLGDELTAAFSAEEDRVERIPQDLSAVDAGEAVVAAAISRFGRLNVLFNNAGITVRAALEETSDTIWEQVIASNLQSVFVLCRSAVPHLKREGGAIVNNASINAIRGNTGLAAYSASKGGVVALTRALATELAPYRIRVNAICPGTIDSPMTDEYLASADEPSLLLEALKAKHPLGRLASVDDVAHAAVFLSTNDAAFITGVALPVDGGRHLT